MINKIALFIFLTAGFCANAQQALFTELNAREGLSNFFNKTNKGDSVTIAYLGGSITAANGYRVQSAALFRDKYKWKVRDINAGLGGTGSDLGAFRFDNDALQFNPDLVFVEFAVNDFDKDSVNIAKAMEGIVRQTKKKNPKTDICFIYTVSKNMFPELKEGEIAMSTRVMERIADYYGIPSINMAATVISLLHQDKLIYETKEENDPQGRIIFSRDGVHPSLAGHQLYTDAIERSFSAMLKMKRNKKNTLPPAMRNNNYELAKYYSVKSFPRSEGFKLMDAKHSLSRFLDVYGDLIYTDNPQDSLVVNFRGTMVGFEDIMGPNSCAFSVSIDGGAPARIPRFDFWSGGYRRSYFLLGELPEGNHRAVIRLDNTPFDKFKVVDPNEVKDRSEYKDNYIYVGKVMMLGEAF